MKPQDKRCASEFKSSIKPEKRRAPQVGGFADNFTCGFSKFGRGGTRSRISFRVVFAKFSLVLSDENTTALPSSQIRHVSTFSYYVLADLFGMVSGGLKCFERLFITSWTNRNVLNIFGEPLCKPWGGRNQSPRAWADSETRPNDASRAENKIPKK